MRAIREILRLYFDLHLTYRGIEQALQVSHGTVAQVIQRFQAAEAVWPLGPDVDDAHLEHWLYPGNTGRPKTRPDPDWALVHQELRSRRHVTLQLLWQEYRQVHPDGYQYTQFCEHYRRYRDRVDLVLRKVYHPGEYLFVDYAGDTLPVVDPRTGTTHTAQVFVAILGYSNLTFVALHPDQTRASWIAGHRAAFEYFGGVPRLVVPDNPKPLVLDTHHDVVLDPSYQEMAGHDHVGIVPARVRKPRDKSKVEGHVLITERAILAPLRHERLHGWGRAQERVAALTDALNTRPFQALAGSRRTLFEADERGALQSLPPTPYVYGEWRFGLTVGRDYHIHLQHAAYSVPWRLVGDVVDARLTSLTVEIFHQHQLVATHPRATRRGQYATRDAHLPPHHAAVRQGWSPAYFQNRAAAIGPETRRLVTTLLERAVQPEQVYTRCRGLLRLAETYGAAVLEQAAQRAHQTEGRTVRAVEAFCVSLQTAPAPRPAGAPHDNLRGAGYFQTTEAPTGKES